MLDCGWSGCLSGVIVKIPKVVNTKLQVYKDSKRKRNLVEAQSELPLHKHDKLSSAGKAAASHA